MSEVRKLKVVILVNEKEFKEIKKKAFSEMKSLSSFGREVLLNESSENLVR